MKKQTHIIVLFPNFYSLKNKILEDVEKRMCVHSVHEVNWSDSCISTNYSRFFAERYAGKSDWVKLCGKGIITCIIVEDPFPVFSNVCVYSGFENVNINLYELEQRYQKWTKEPYSVYVTYNEIDTIRTLLLLLPLRIEDLFKCEETHKKIFKHSYNPPGAKDWENVEELFYALGIVSDYVVLHYAESERKFEILTRSRLTQLSPILNSPARVKGKRLCYSVSIDGKVFELEFWDAANSYFDAWWVQDLFKTRINTRGFWELNAENSVYLYIYSAFLLRSSITDDIVKQTDELWLSFKSRQEKDTLPLSSSYDDYWYHLQQWMLKHKYQFTRHSDSSLPYNSRILELEPICCQLRQITGYRDLKPLMVNRYGWGGYVYFQGYDKSNRLFIKWGGTGESAQAEYNATKRLHDLSSRHFSQPKAYYNQPGRRYFAMEFLDGKDLRTLINENRLTPEDKNNIAVQLETISATLFQAKMVHRDIRPENLYLLLDGTLKLIDCQWTVRYDAYSEITQVYHNPKLIRKLGDRYAVAKYVWDDHYSINLIMDELLGADDISLPHITVRGRIGKQELRFFEPPKGANVHQRIQPRTLYELHREWLQEYGNEEQVYQLDRAWLMKASDEQAVYLLDKAWLEKKGDEEALYQLNRAWLEKTADEKAVYLLDKSWLEKHGDEEALYKLNRAWLEKTADERAVYLLDKEWHEKNGDEEALYELNRAWLEKTADEKAVYLLDKAWQEKNGDEEALYKLNRAWLEKTADEKAVYLLDKAWLEKNGDEEALYRLNRAWLEKTADERAVYLLDKAWLEKHGDKAALYQLEKAWLVNHGTREEQYRHEKQYLIDCTEDKQKLYQLDCAWFRSNKDYDSLHRLEKDWLIAHKASADEIFELDCKWYQQTGKIAEWYNLKKSRLLRMGSLREIRTFENTHEIRRRSYLRIGKWLYLRRRWQWNMRQVVLRIGRREWVLSRI